MKFLPPAAAADKLGRKKTWLYDKLKHDPTFPRPVSLSDESGGPVYIEHELEAWMNSRIQACRGEKEEKRQNGD